MHDIRLTAAGRYPRKPPSPHLIPVGFLSCSSPLAHQSENLPVLAFQFPYNNWKVKKFPLRRNCFKGIDYTFASSRRIWGCNNRVLSARNQSGVRRCAILPGDSNVPNLCALEDYCMKCKSGDCYYEELTNSLLMFWKLVGLPNHTLPNSYCASRIHLLLGEWFERRDSSFTTLELELTEFSWITTIINFPQRAILSSFLLNPEFHTQPAMKNNYKLPFGIVIR